MTNNELSRKVLEYLLISKGRVKFRDLVTTLETEERTVFKNLFFLEDRGYIKLSTSYPTDAVYPLIHLIRLREAGEELALDARKLDAAFPLSEGVVDLKPLPPNLDGIALLTFTHVLEAMALRIRNSMDGDERDSALERIESLLALPVADEPIRGKP